MDSALQTALRSPGLRLHGVIDDSWIDRLLAASESAEDALFVVEVTTTGGDAEIGRRLALEIRHWRARGGPIAFLGKTCVYSAGVVFMTGFAPEDRWLSEDCWLLVHERQMTTEIKLDGPLRACADQLRKVTAEVEAGLVLEQEGFNDLAAGSHLSFDDIARRARDNWYVSPEKAVGMGLAAGLFPG